MLLAVLDPSTPPFDGFGFWLLVGGCILIALALASSPPDA